MAHIVTIPAFILTTVPILANIPAHDPESSWVMQISSFILGLMLWVLVFRLPWPQRGVDGGHLFGIIYIDGGPRVCFGVQIALPIIWVATEQGWWLASVFWWTFGIGLAVLVIVSAIIRGATSSSELECRRCGSKGTIDSNGLCPIHRYYP